jgi:TetR/AcrR family transcriptional repressor of nem operon
VARPRNFDQDFVLGRAVDVFWSKGYSGTSVSDLTKEMGLSKSSLYDSFGSKHDLFLTAMDYYRNNVTARIRSIVDLKAPPKQIIASVVGRSIDRILAPSGKRGCFMNNCASEVAPVDPDAAERSAAGFAVMEDTFCHLIERGQKQGSISGAKTARALARFMTATINGIMVVGKANPDRAYLTDIADTALGALD